MRNSPFSGYRKCEYCSFLIAETIPDNVRVQAILEDHAIGILGDENSKKKKDIYQERLNTIKKFASMPKNILDIGCGNGSFLKYLLSKGYRSCGYDKSKKIQKYLHMQKIPMYKGLRDIPDHSMDIITCFDVIEHTTKPRVFIRKIKQKMRNNAILMLGTPNAYGFSSLALGRKWWVFGPGAHFSLFSLKSLKFFLEQEGFDVLSVRTDNLTPWFTPTNTFVHKILNKLVYLLTRPVQRFLFTLSLGDNINAIGRYGT